YSFVLWALFVRQPSMGVLQLITLVVAWSHAMIGLYFWLRVRPWFERMRALGLVIAVLVPVLAILGVVEAARHVMALAAEPGCTAPAYSKQAASRAFPMPRCAAGAAAARPAGSGCAPRRRGSRRLPTKKPGCCAGSARFRTSASPVNCGPLCPSK